MSWTTKKCPHVDVKGIYGDEVNRAGGKRLWCADCGQLLEGPVSIAEDRQMLLKAPQEHWRSVRMQMLVP
jgi:hypothetical protein